MGRIYCPESVADRICTTTFQFTPTLANYEEVLFRSEYLQYMIDSLIVSGGAVLVSVLVAVPAAYALARYNFKRKEDLAFQILSFKFAPEILIWALSGCIS